MADDDHIHRVTDSHTDKPASSPLPSPETLAEYDRLIPGASEEMLKMLAAETEHRRSLERKYAATATDEVRLVQGLRILTLALLGLATSLVALSSTGIPVAVPGAIAAIAATVVAVARSVALSDEHEPEKDDARTTPMPPGLHTLVAPLAGARASVRVKKVFFTAGDDPTRTPSASPSSGLVMPQP